MSAEEIDIDNEAAFSARIEAFREGSRAFLEHKPGQPLDPAEIGAEALRIVNFAREEFNQLAAESGVPVRLPMYGVDLKL